ncbi:MAG: hypothetical protein HXY34_05895 [Candidatus Thorarchaeota archaeon]|nr:hypothetical protein [Candidatus Thorarchaeota archaeon]
MSFVLEYDEKKGNMSYPYIAAQMSHYFLQGEREISDLKVKYVGHLANQGKLYLMFSFDRKKNNGNGHKVSNETVNRVIESTVGDSLGVDLALWAESEKDLYEYVQRLMQGISPVN